MGYEWDIQGFIPIPFISHSYHRPSTLHTLLGLHTAGAPRTVLKAGMVPRGASGNHPEPYSWMVDDSIYDSNDLTIWEKSWKIIV